MSDYLDFCFGAEGPARKLVCWPERLEYDFKTHTGKLYLSAGGCCDMNGCISTFQVIDLEVGRIDTYSGDELDIIYMKRRTGWEACDPPRSTKSQGNS